MTEPGGPRRAAVLIDRGGYSGEWLDACLAAIGRCTTDPMVLLAVEKDRASTGAALPSWCVEVRGAGGRGDCLQLAYDAARRAGVEHFVALDPAVLPIADSWISQLVEALDEGAAMAGILRNLGNVSMASCLCSTVDFIEREGLRFDRAASGESPLDALVGQALELGARLHDVPVSSRNQLRGFPGAIYGDVVYDHGVRPYALPSGDLGATAPDLGSLGDDLILCHREAFIDWLRGKPINGSVCFVLGMHRSGTSTLTAALEQCGLFLGKTYRSPMHDQPRGNFERADGAAINDRLLADAGGTWDRPPHAPIEAADAIRQEMAALVAELQANAPGGLKDPRLLLTIDAWLDVVELPLYVGTYRHPVDVAKSLWHRDRIPEAQAFDLWNRYNGELVRLHRAHRFALIEFDLSDHAAYVRNAATVAAGIGLRPLIDAVHGVVDVSSTGTQDQRRIPVPEQCRSIYEYLEAHSYHRHDDPNELATLLAAWEDAQPRSAPPARSRPAGRRLYAIGQRLPRPLRKNLWRAWRLFNAPRPE